MSGFSIHFNKELQNRNLTGTIKFMNIVANKSKRVVCCRLFKPSFWWNHTVSI